MRLIVALACCCWAAQAAVLTVPRALSDEDLYKLPEGLLFGAGVSAAQAEGATSADGKSVSALDATVHALPKMYPENNDVSADHYHRFKEDLALAKQMKLTSHRFSISWSRIFPSGNMSEPNPKGVQFYSDYIDEIRKNGIEPLVTMYHFDHPYSMEKSTNGWTSNAMVDNFVLYSDFLFKTYGHKVKYWNPINEGNMYCIYLPLHLHDAKLSSVDPVDSYYRCTHNLIRAHAKVYRLYKKTYFASQQGQVGSCTLIWPTTPQTLDYADIQAADIFNELFAGIMIHPLIYGDYPPIARYLVDKRSKEQGLAESRLPHFTDEDKALFTEDGPATDFVALNVYSGFKVRWGTANTGNVPIFLVPVVYDTPFLVVESGGGFTSNDPDLMKTAVLWAWNNYHLPIVITENGWGDSNHVGLHDEGRAAYFSMCLRSLVRTANEYQIPLISYHAWSLLDVFEFTAGYTTRPYGLVHVDYSSDKLTRTLKDSSKFFIEMAETGRVPDIRESSGGSGGRGLAALPGALAATLLACFLH